MVFLANEKS